MRNHDLVSDGFLALTTASLVLLSCLATSIPFATINARRKQAMHDVALVRIEQILGLRLQVIEMGPGR